jgi:hypothetical protein
MIENLRTTRYPDGSPIALLESQSSWFASTDTAMTYAGYYLAMKDFTLICIFISTICITERCFIKTSVIFINLKS